MDLIAVLRVLWRHRMVMAVVALLAVIAGLATAFRIGFPPKLESRQQHVGVATVTALVDTPSSQVVDLGGKAGADIATLAGKAALLSSLMTNSPIKEEVARRAGVPPNTLIAVPPATAVTPGVAQTTPVSTSRLSLTDPRASILRATVPNLESGEIPIVAVQTQAPTAATAARLANEAIAVLKTHVDSVAGNDGIPDRRRIVVTQLGQAEATSVARGPSPSRGLIVAVLMFAFAGLAIIGLDALIGAWHRGDMTENAFVDLLVDGEPISDETYGFATVDTDGTGEVDQPPTPSRNVRATGAVGAFDS